MLPFFANILSSNQDFEPVYAALFEITFDLPAILGRTTTEVQLLLENARNISLPLTPDIEVQTQRFKFSTRAYVTLPTQTHVADLSVNFNLNENDRNGVYVWNILKAWYDLAWNSQTGETHTKREMVGNIIVNQHNKSGQVIRRVTYINCQIFGISEIELSWEETTKLLECSARWVCDYYEDLYIDQ
jgi:hypothetical protein